MTTSVQTKVGNAVKALILRDGRLLVQERRDDEHGFWYTLPGGNVAPGENLTDALQRRCLEKLGTGVTVQGLRFVRECIYDKHPFWAEYTRGSHEVDFIFTCDVANGYDPAAAPRNARGYVLAVKWLPLSELVNLKLYPSGLAATLLGQRPPLLPGYLGDMY